MSRALPTLIDEDRDEALAACVLDEVHPGQRLIVGAGPVVVVAYESGRRFEGRGSNLARALAACRTLQAVWRGE